MPPHVGSRYSFCDALTDERGRLYLSDREPYGYVAHADNRLHIVVQGDTLFSLAGQYFAPLPRACGYWWAIADFQPEPIVDPTLELGAVGASLVIPPLRVLTDIILADPRGARA
jgi:hypothetical protein